MSIFLLISASLIAIAIFHLAGYRHTSNTRRTKYQNLQVSRLVWQLSLLKSLKPGVKWRMKMSALLQQHLSDRQIHCLLAGDSYQRLDDILHSKLSWKNTLALEHPAPHTQCYCRWMESHSGNNGNNELSYFSVTIITQYLSISLYRLDKFWDVNSIHFTSSR